MRKFSKILTVLLTLALLCGVILSVVAQAEETPSLNVTGAAKNVCTDFEDPNTNGKVKPKPSWEWGDSNAQNTQVTYETVGGNTYAKYSSKGNGTAANANTPVIWVDMTDYTVSAQKAGTNIGMYDYVVVDFEIGTDEYSYQDVNGAWHTVATLEEIPEDKRPAENEAYKALAFKSGMELYLDGRALVTFSSSLTGKALGYHCCYIVQDPSSGKWYVGNASTYADSTSKVELSNKIGEFDHITFVIKVVRTEDETRTTGCNLNNSTFYAFVNGAYLTEKKVAANVDSVAICALYFSGISNQDQHVLCLDNVALNFYGYRAMTAENKYSDAGVVYQSEGYGIDDYITSGDYKKLPLWLCEEIVYNDFTGEKDGSAYDDEAPYVNPNGEAMIGAKLYALEEGGTLTINKSYSSVVIFDKNQHFNIVAEDGATITLSPDTASRYNVKTTVDGDTTTYEFLASTGFFAQYFENTYNMTGDSNNRVNNMSGVIKNATQAPTTGWTTYRERVAIHEQVVGANGNKYMRVSLGNSTGGSAAPTNENFTAGNIQTGPSVGTKSVKGYDYFTLDFDFGVGGYKYSWKEELPLADGTGTGTATKYSTDINDIPAKIRESGNYTKGDLAYPSGWALYWRNDAAAGDWGEDYGVTFAKNAAGKYVVKATATANSTYATVHYVNTNGIELANEVGIFDHFSYVYDINYAEDGTTIVSSDVYLYVNGKLLFHKTTTRTATHHKVEKITMANSWTANWTEVLKYYTSDVAADHFKEFYDKYATIWDNIAANFYKASNENTQYLDAFFGESFDKNANLSECDGVVYNEGYFSPNNGYMFSNNGGESYINNLVDINAAIEAVKSGDEIIANFDVIDLIPASNDIKSLIVKLINGADLTLPQLWTELYDIVKFVDGDEITYLFVLKGETLDDITRLNVTNGANNKYADGSNDPGFATNTGSEIQYNIVAGADGNKYYRHTWRKGSTGRYVYTWKSPEDTFFPGIGNVSGAGDVGQYDYFTWDADIGTDSYKFSYKAMKKTKSYCASCSETEAAAEWGAASEVTLEAAVSSPAEFEAYVAEFALYQTAKAENANLEADENFATNYPLISKLIYEYAGTSSSTCKSGHYKTTVGAITEVTAIDANQTLDLAYAAGTIGWTFRGYSYDKAGTTAKRNNDEIPSGLMSVVKEAGVWCLSVGGTKIPLKNEVGAFDHITYVFAISKNGTSYKYKTYPNDTNADGKCDSNDEAVVVDTGRPTINCVAYAFVNGNYAAKGNVTSNSFEKMYAQRLRYVLSSSTLSSRGWSIALDNLASNYYKTAEHDTTGLSALIAAIEGGNTNVNISNYNNVLYGKDYVDLGGWTSFDGGKNVYYVDGAIASAADTLVNGATVITSKDILGFTPKAGVTNFKVELVNGAEFTLSEAALKDLWVVEPVDADTLNVVKYSEEDLVEFNFIYNEKTIHTVGLLPGMSLDVSDATEIIANIFNEATNEVSSATSWKIGDADANGYVATAGDIGTDITVEPVIGVLGTLETFAVTYVDENGLTKLIGDFDEYPTTDNFYATEITAPTNVISDSAFAFFKSSIENAPAGATVTLLYSKDADMGAGTNLNDNTDRSGGITIKTNITLNLNGKALVQSYGCTNNFAPGMFNVGANVTFDICGGKLYQVYSQPEETQTVFGYGAITTTTNSVVNITDIEFVGGTLVDIAGSNAKVNVNRGTYHHELRSAYALFAGHGANVSVTINNAKFTNTEYIHYAIFYDYGGATSHIEAYNSQFVCTTDDGATPILFIHSTNAGSTAYFENCDIIGKNGTINGSVTIGSGCNVSGFDVGKNNVSLAEDVSHAYGNNFSMSVSAPKMDYGTASGCLVKNEETGLSYVKPGYYRLNTATFWGTLNPVCEVYFTTVASEVEAAKTVTWYGVGGEELYVEKWIDGSTVTVKEAPAKVDLDWYDVFYTWDTTVVSGDTAINPVANLEDGKVTAYAQMTLGDDMILSVYLPKEEGVAVDVNATLDEEAYTLTVEEIGGVEYYVISWISEAGSFATATATVNFTVTNADYDFEAIAASAEVVLDVVRYASSVVAQFDHDSVEADLVTEMVNYKEAVASYLGEYTRNDATTAFFKLHTDAACACGVEKAVSGSEVADLEALIAKGITGATYEITTLGTLNMVLSGAEGLEVWVSYKVGNVQGTPVVEKFKANYVEKAGGYVVSGLTVAYIDNIMTIEVDGATGQYCLAAYINSLETLVLPEGVDRAKLTTLANALYEYAMAAEAYKHVPAAQ